MSDWYALEIEFTERHPTSEERMKIAEELHNIDEDFDVEGSWYSKIGANGVTGHFPDHTPKEEFVQRLHEMGFPCRGRSAPEDQDGEFWMPEWPSE